MVPFLISKKEFSTVGRKSKEQSKIETSRTVFVVEGHTEEDYLKQALCIKIPDAVINPSCTDAYNLIQEAKKRLRQINKSTNEAIGIGYEKAFVLFDKDKNPLFSSLTPDDRITYIVSNPSIDYPLSVHFENRHHAKKKDCETVLNNHGFKDYKKTLPRERLMKHIKEKRLHLEAMKRLKVNDSALGLNEASYPNARLLPQNTPNSNFYQVIEHLIGL
jgi:hypothetical protein